MTGLNSRWPRDRSRTKSALPSLPLPRSDTVSSAKRSSSVVSTVLKRCGLAGVLVDLPVLRLRRADLVEVDAVVFVDRGLLGLALAGLGIAAVVEAVLLPGDAGDLDPVERVGQRLLRRQLHHLVLLPVGAALGDAVDGVLRVRRRRERRQPRRPAAFPFVRDRSGPPACRRGPSGCRGRSGPAGRRSW